jgi:hypothetical protein
LGHQIIFMGELALGIILAYVLVSNFKGTSQVSGTILKGVPPIITSLQGVGPGYPAPAR